MRILLVALNAKYVHTNISLRTMSRMTAHLPVTTRLLERTVNEPLDRILEDILTDPPDLLAFSVYIWNVEAVGRLTALVQAVRPGLHPPAPPARPHVVQTRGRPLGRAASPRA